MTDNLRRHLAPLNDLLGRAFGIRVVAARSTGVRINNEWIQRLRYFDRLVERVRGVEGTFVECGVASGQSLAMLASLARVRGDERGFWGFDTFTGLPAPAPEDLTSTESVAIEGMFAWASTNAVVRELRGHGFPDDWISRNLQLRKGLFAEALPFYDGGPIALLHVDGDLYESYRTALRTLWPQLSVGGVAAFDEYEAPDLWPGARRAVDEFLDGLAPNSFELVRDEASEKWFAIRRA